MTPVPSRGTSDLIEWAAAAISASGTFRTYCRWSRMSVVEGRADLRIERADFRV